MSHKYFECQCEDAEHVLRFTYWPEDSDIIVFVSIHLKSMSLLQRIKFVIKYIFGFKSKYGDFSETLLNLDTIKELRDYCNEILEKP